MSELSGDKPIRLKDIADRCGISTMTVSRALRGDGRTSPLTVERVRKIAAEMGYDPFRQSAARRLVQIRTGQHELNRAIGFVFWHSGLTDTNYFIYTMQGVYDAVKDEDFEVVTSDIKRLEEMDGLPIIYRKGDIDGLLVITDQGNPRWPVIYEKLRSDPAFGDRPIVGMVASLDGCSSVFPDNFDAGYQAASHLLDLGHRYILLTRLFLPVGTSSYALRDFGIQKAYRDRGLEAEHYLVSHEQDWSPQFVEERHQDVTNSLRLRPEVTAIIADNDYIAGLVYTTLVRNSMSVPDDISLISFDDTEAILNDNRENILTTVRLPLRQIGFEAEELLLRRITGEEKEDRDIVLPVELVVRSSTASPSPTRASRAE